jgi:NAD(P)H dehydrogenase (quinone)
MGDVNVLVVFYSRYGHAERLALAVGVGAIQAKANIRLRRVADLADVKTIEADASWREHHARMQMDYVRPRQDDPPWADVIVLGTPAESCDEVEAFLRSLRTEPVFAGKLAGKIAAPIAPGDRASALGPLYAAAAHAGLTVVPHEGEGSDAIAGARAYGRRVAQMARAFKHAAADLGQPV